MYVTAVSAISHMSVSQLSVVPISLWDKAVHFIEYVPIGFLMFAWLMNVDLFLSRRKNAAVCIALILVLAGLDELHQAFVPTRNSDVLDVLADTLGGTLGMAVSIGYKGFLRKLGADRVS